MENWILCGESLGKTIIIEISTRVVGRKKEKNFGAVSPKMQ